MTDFNLSPETRKQFFSFVIERLEHYYAATANEKVTPELTRDAIRTYTEIADFGHPFEDQKALDHLLTGLEQFAVHTPHPAYFGLFNPRTNFLSILSDLITAVFNPQLAAWSHAPFAVEVENYLIREFAVKFGYNALEADGVFTSGGAESNLTALLCALNAKLPRFSVNGLWGVPQMPVVYCSAEAHHSLHKAARITGLGHDAVRSIPVNERQQIDIGQLSIALKKDITEDLLPLMVVGTAGTTGTGAVDDLIALNKLADQYNLWFHADAAYGGGAILHPDARLWLDGIGMADSITFDAHKWMSVPMATSMFITRHKSILSHTFSIRTDYMPKDATEQPVIDPFTHSIQWSRRSIGIKLYLSLLFFGWKGYEEVIGHQIAMGDYLRWQLKKSGWTVCNQAAMPVICFTDNFLEINDDFIPYMVHQLVASGKTWVSTYPVHGRLSIRACITNYDTTEKDIDMLLNLLNIERDKYRA
ncbi:MAG: aminotransferase class V-fold PLP-dependent enzyme [Saprospiraceae bacterium]|nr:aminotransferase class V-fold PLP-dependent enzyme [Saprospiraceae bacterium]